MAYSQKLQTAPALSRFHKFLYLGLQLGGGPLNQVKVPFHSIFLEAAAAFSKLKGLLTSAPILIQPDPPLQFVVQVDASDTGVGAVLSK